MESVLSPPAPFRFDKNSLDVASGTLNESWKKWRSSYEVYSKACELSKKNSDVQLNILLHVVGEDCREILTQAAEKCNTAESVLKKLDEHFEVKKNVTVERHTFFTRNQKEDETVEQYVFELRRLSQTCEFKDLQEELIKDRLVCGVRMSVIRERLLREEDLTLKKALEICRAVIASKTYSKNITMENKPVHEIGSKDQTDNEVWAVGKRRSMSTWGNRGGVRSRGRGAGAGGRGQHGERAAPAQRAPMAGSRHCARCGGRHAQYQCPAFQSLQVQRSQ